MENATNKDKLEFVTDVINDILNRTNNASGFEAGNIAYDILDIYHEEWEHIKKLQRLVSIGLNKHFRIGDAILGLATRIVSEREINMENVTWYRA